MRGRCRLKPRDGTARHPPARKKRASLLLGCQPIRSPTNRTVDGTDGDAASPCSRRTSSPHRPATYRCAATTSAARRRTNTHTAASHCRTARTEATPWYPSMPRALPSRSRPGRAVCASHRPPNAVRPSGGPSLLPTRHRCALLLLVVLLTGRQPQLSNQPRQADPLLP